MHDSDMTKPYQATENANLSGSTSTHAFVNWIPVILLAFAGLILGTIGYVATVIIVENRHVDFGFEPRLSYGEKAGLSLVLCAIMCAMIGMSLGLLVGRRAFFGTIILIASGFLGGLIVILLWSEQITNHGRDPSEIVLYYPPMSVAIACLLFAIPTGLIAFQQSKRSLKHLRD